MTRRDNPSICGGLTGVAPNKMQVVVVKGAGKKRKKTLIDSYPRTKLIDVKEFSEFPQTTSTRLIADGMLFCQARVYFFLRPSSRSLPKPPSIDYRIFRLLSETDGLREEVCTLAGVGPKVVLYYDERFLDIGENQNLEKRDSL